MQKHICGQCKKEFKKEEDYLNHRCEVLGRKPTETEAFKKEKK